MALRLCQVSARTFPSACASLVPKLSTPCSSTTLGGASRSMIPEMSTSPFTTMSPSWNRASPPQGSMWVTRPVAVAMTLVGWLWSFTSGESPASRTNTSRQVPRRFRAQKDSSSMASINWFSFSRVGIEGPKEPTSTPHSRRRLMISSAVRFTLPLTSMVKITWDPRAPSTRQANSPASRA